MNKKRSYKIIIKNINELSAIKAYLTTNCPYCNCKLTTENISKDHVIPKSLLSIDNMGMNIIYCCKKCNNRKSNQSLLEFLGLIPKIKEKQNV